MNIQVIETVLFKPYERYGQQILAIRDAENLTVFGMGKLLFDIIVREDFQKKIIIFMEFSTGEGGGYPPSVEIINFLKKI